MVKKLVLVAVLIVGGMAGYNLITTGELRLMPSSNLSPEEQRLNALEERIDAATRQITAAGRSAGLAGIDTSSSAESALIELERVEKDLLALKRKTPSGPLRDRIERLLRRARSARGEG